MIKVQIGQCKDGNCEGHIATKSRRDIKEMFNCRTVAIDVTLMRELLEPGPLECTTQYDWLTCVYLLSPLSLIHPSEKGLRYVSI